MERHETERKRPEKKKPEKKEETARELTAEEREELESIVRAEQQRPAIEELGGESEASLEEAHHDERGSTHYVRHGVFTREPLTVEPEPDELGRRFLEEATQAPVDPHAGDEDRVLVPPEEE